jgi:hypothetical protein
VVDQGNGHDEVVRLLLAYDADIRPENLFGKTAFDNAMYKQRVGCIRILLVAKNQYDAACSRLHRGALELRCCCGCEWCCALMVCATLQLPRRSG